MHGFLRLPMVCAVVALLAKVYGLEAVALFVVSVLVGFILSRAARS